MKASEAEEMIRVKDDRDVAFIALVGSRNYNLHNEASDYDFIGFTSPYLEEMYHNNHYFKELKGTTLDNRGGKDWFPEPYEIRIHDIRKLPGLLWKSNPSYLEILFSKDICIYDDYVWLVRDRENIARINLPYLYNASMGIVLNKIKYLEKGTSNTKELVEKHGYDPKMAMHALRGLYMIRDYAGNNFTNYEQCVRSPGSHIYTENHLKHIKEGYMNIEDIKDMIGLQIELAEGCKESYMSKEPDEELNLKIRDGIKEIVLEPWRKT